MTDRRPRIASATIERRHFWLKPHEWKKIEKAYGRPIDSHLRRKIELATETLLTYCEIEQTAAPVAEVRQRIEKLLTTATAFQKTILNCNCSADANDFAVALIGKHLDEVSSHAWINSALNTATDVVVGCIHALKALDETNISGRKPGEAWNHWVRQLTGVLKKQGLPTGAPKGSDKTSSDNPAPFVAFIEELQLRATNTKSHSFVALTQAISRARAEPPTLSSRKTRSRDSGGHASSA
jgi:hypothetical protein